MRTPALSLMRTFIMMLGEVDYIATFLEPYIDGDPTSMHFGGLTFAFLIVFVLLMPILLMNLLVSSHLVFFYSNMRAYCCCSFKFPTAIAVQIP